jgi:hypothetical protein
MTAAGEVVAEHVLVAPGAAQDDGEKEFCALGPVAEAFITGAAAAGNTLLGPELAELGTLRAAHGDEAFAAALDRAVAFGRWRAADVRSILAAGSGTADPRPAEGRAGPAAARGPGPAAGRLRTRQAVMTAAMPPLAADLAAGPRRLKLAAIRQLAPELLITAKTQRWAPAELLRIPSSLNRRIHRRTVAGWQSSSSAIWPAANPCSDINTVTARVPCRHRPCRSPRSCSISQPGPLANTLTGRILTTTSPGGWTMQALRSNPRRG